MAHVGHLFVTLLIFVIPFGVINGFTISSRDSKLSAGSEKLSSLSPKFSTSSTETPGGIDLTKTFSFQSSSQSQPTHIVPLDIVSVEGKSKRRNKSNSNRAISLVKREVNPAEEQANGLSYYFDPNMVMSKRSAAALNKMLLALPSFYEPSSRIYGGDDGEPGVSNKERSYLGSSTSSMDGFQYLPNVPQRRGQKDGNKKFLRCFFNAVSCFRK